MIKNPSKSHFKNLKPNNLQSKLENLKFLSHLKLKSRTHRQKSIFNKSKSTKSLNYLWIVFFVKRFIEVLKMKTLESKLKKFEPYHQSIFDDVVFFPNETKKNKLNLKMFKRHV